MTPDFLRPIGKSNRKEAILVKLHGVLVNTNYAILKAFMEDVREDPEMLMEFPKLRQLLAKRDGLGPQEAAVLLEHFCTLYPPGGIIFFAFSDGHLSREQCEALYQKYYEKCKLVRTGQTLVCATLCTLSNSEFLTDLYVQIDTEDKQAIHFVKAFVEPAYQKANKARLHLIVGELSEILRAHQNITTGFVNCAANLDALDTDLNRELLKNRSWVMPVNYPDFGEKLSISYQAEKYDKWRTDKFCEVGFYYPYPIEGMV